MPSPQPVVTISAAYGAGGSAVAPELARRWGVPFIDRLLSADVSEEASSSVKAAASTEGLSEEEAATTPGSRLFTYLARAAGVGAIAAPEPIVEPEEELRAQSEAGLADLHEGSGGVVLGRAGAVVLRDHPHAYHIRLDGPKERRITAAAALEHITEERAAERLARTDRARELWVRRLYRADALDPCWYHLWLDSTVLGFDGTVEVVAFAVDRWRAADR